MAVVDLIPRNRLQLGKQQIKDVHWWQILMLVTAGDLPVPAPPHTTIAHVAQASVELPSDDVVHVPAQGLQAPGQVLPGRRSAGATAWFRPGGATNMHLHGNVGRPLQHSVASLKAFRTSWWAPAVAGV